MAHDVSHRAIIGTFHKTGSVLWQTICEKASREGVFRHWNLDVGAEDPDAEVVLSLHAHRATSILKQAGRPVTEKDRWLVCLRDPRDLIISAAHYHSTTHEAWCHKPVSEFGGLTYQEKINSFTDLSDKFLFEMENSGGRAVRNMTAHCQELPEQATHFVKLEDLLLDRELEVFRRAFAFLGFTSGQLVDLLAIAVEASFFSDPQALERSNHARAGRVAEFREAFDERVTQRFHVLFPDSLDVLGYPIEGMPTRPNSGLGGQIGEPIRNWPSRRPVAEVEARVRKAQDAAK